jgi:hypothetical protein
MKLTILAVMIAIAGLGNMSYSQTDTQPDISVFYTDYNAKGEITRYTVRQQRSDGSWYEHQNYIYQGKYVAWKKVLSLVDVGLFDIKKEMMFFKGDSSFFRYPLNGLKLSDQRIAGYEVYEGKEASRYVYYSNELNVVLRREFEDGSYQVATKVLNMISPESFKKPDLPVNYDFFIKELDAMKNKKLADELRKKYVPKDYKIDGQYFINDK